MADFGLPRAIALSRNESITLSLLEAELVRRLFRDLKTQNGRHFRQEVVPIIAQFFVALPRNLRNADRGQVRISDAAPDESLSLPANFPGGLDGPGWGEAKKERALYCIVALLVIYGSEHPAPLPQECFNRFGRLFYTVGTDEENARQINQMRGEFADLTRRVEANTDAITGLRGEVAGLRDEVAANAVRVERTLNGFVRIFANMHPEREEEFLALLPAAGGDDIRPGPRPAAGDARGPANQDVLAVEGE